MRNSGSVYIFMALIGIAAMPFDLQVLAYINAHSACRPIFEIITDAGLSAWYLWPSALIFLAGIVAWKIKRFPERFSLLWRAGTLMFFAVGGAGIFVNILKPIFARARPKLWEDHITGFFHYGEVLSGQLSKYNSFPSGHAATALAAATVIAMLLPLKKKFSRIAVFVVAGVIAASRVMVGAHHVSDTIVGAVIGIWAAVITKNYLARAEWAAAISKPETLQ